MNESNKKAALKAVEALKPLSSTNLWHGLKLGLKAFENERHTLQSVQALYVLTDGVYKVLCTYCTCSRVAHANAYINSGMPNHMCPKQGYVTKLRPILQLLGHRMPMIHTFGFGYNIRSGLLQAIAEVGGGTFAFIPDAGMIGTISMNL